jgi:hypothetical protein
MIAKQILESKGIVYTEEKLDTLREEVLRTPEKARPRLLYIGYALAIMMSLFGLVMGMGIWQARTTLPNGQRIFKYDEKTRTHGCIIAIVALGIFAFRFLLVTDPSFATFIGGVAGFLYDVYMLTPW